MGFGDSYSVGLKCLVPWLTFQDIVRFRPRSILLTSGTQYVGEGAEGEVPLPAPQSTRDKADADIRKHHKKRPIEDSLYFHL